MCFQYVEDMSILGDMSPRRIVKKDGFLVAHESNICPETLKIMIAIYYNHITTIKGKDSNHIWFDGYHIILDPSQKCCLQPTIYAQWSAQGIVYM